MQLRHLIQTAARKLMIQGSVLKSERWQGIELKNPMYETIKVYLGPAQMPGTIPALVEETHPNLPWAEDHFQERIAGVPLNPGETYKSWPFYKMDEQMRPGGVFSHTYMERFWPKYARGYTVDFIEAPTENGMVLKRPGATHGMTGIRYEYGDLNDVINQIKEDPYTRQAFLPIFFPEDTGAVHKGRVPCTIGYLFQFREGRLHVTYYIRSCDFIRHFQDDVYMAVRLVHHICDRLENMDSDFRGIEPGAFDMHIGSLHIFQHEVRRVARQFNLEWAIRNK